MRDRETLRTTVVRELRVPTLPNFIITSLGESIPVKDLEWGAVKQLANKMRDGLIAKWRDAHREPDMDCA